MARLTTLDGNPLPAHYLPLTITATLQQGAALDTPYGTGFDGLLASALRDRAKSALAVPGSLYDGGLDTPTPAVTALPLAVCGLSRSTSDAPGVSHAGEWHWASTTAHPAHQPGTPADFDVHHVHTRINERQIEAAATRIPAALPPSSGRFRNRRLPVVTIPTTHLTWRAVGDPAIIQDLLGDLPSIGAHRHRGEGTVLAWDVTSHPDTDPNTWDDYAHLHHDGQLGRPTPGPCLERLQHRHPHLHPTHQAPVGIRPPAWHQATRRILHMPAPLTPDPPTGGQ